MKRIIHHAALALAVALLTALLWGTAITGVAEALAFAPVLSLENCKVVLDKASGMLRVHDLRSGEWYLMSPTGERRTSEPYTELGDLYSRGVRGLTLAEVDDPNGSFHNKGILGPDGSVLVPPEYIRVEALSDRWQVGIKAKPCKGEDSDITKEVQINGKGKKLFYRIDAADVYYRGEHMATLDRLSFADAMAFGDYIGIMDRAKAVTFYDKRFEPSDYPTTSYSMEYRETYMREGRNYYHLGSGQQAFAEGCTLSADEVSNSLKYDTGTCQLLDLQGNVLIQMEQGDMIFDDDFLWGSCARFRRGNKFGIISLEGEIIISPEYDDIDMDFCPSYGSLQYGLLQYGYVRAVKDGKVGILDASGNVVVDFLFAEDDIRGNSLFNTIENDDGSLTLISSVSGQLDGHFKRVDNRVVACVAVDTEGRIGLLDMAGRVRIPFDSEIWDINLSIDGRVALVQTNSTSFDVFIFDELMDPAAATGEWAPVQTPAPVEARVLVADSTPVKDYAGAAPAVFEYGDLSYCQIVAGSGVLIVTRKGESGCRLMTPEGEILTENYRNMDEVLDLGLIRVAAYDGDEIHNLGILDSDGRVVVPPVYAEIKVGNDPRWIAGVRVVACEAGEQDYSFQTASNFEKGGFYRIDEVDFYYDGEKAGTLKRSDCKLSTWGTTYGAFMSIENWDGEAYFYDRHLQRASALEGSGLEYVKVNDTLTHRGTGQRAFVPECTLSAEEVNRANALIKGKVMDLQGNVLFQMPSRYKLENMAFRFGDGFAVFRDLNTYNYLLVTEDGQVVMESDSYILEPTPGSLRFGFRQFERDNSYAIMDAEGELVSDFYALEDIAGRRSGFIVLEDVAGSFSVVTGGASALEDRYTEVRFPGLGRACACFVGKREDDTLGVVNVYGEALVPFSDDFVWLHASLDGSVVVGRRDDTFKVYMFPADNNDTWTCENGHEGNSGKFCTQCGAAKPAEPEEDETWTCENGHESNTSNFCSQCGAARREEAPEDDGTWTCENGHAGNEGKFCTECGAARPEEAPEDDGTWTCENGHAGNTTAFCPLCGAKKP